MIFLSISLLSRHVVLKGGSVEKKEESMRFKLINPSHFPLYSKADRPLLEGGLRQWEGEKKQITVICFHGGGRDPASSCVLARWKDKRDREKKSERLVKRSRGLWGYRRK